jgi:hypothetical protein
MKLDIGSKHITINKWKGKNKKAFVKSLNAGKIDELKVMEDLVYSCIEEDVALSLDEFRYVLTRIRDISLGSDITVEFFCDKCHESFKKTFDVKELITFTYKKLDEIKVDDVKIKIGPIRNKKKYIEMVSEDEEYDFLFRVDSINGNDTFTMDELIDIFDEMDVDKLTKIMEIWEEHRFKVHDVHEIECPSCSHKQKYKFDELPQFFPDSWFK